MSPAGHDYTRHSIEELEQESANLDCHAHPARAKSLQDELLRRLLKAESIASETMATRALAEGAQYGQLTPHIARRFFWPFLGFNFLVSGGYGFLVGFVSALIGGIVESAQARSGGSVSNPSQWIQLAIFLVLAVPFASFWLKVMTKRTFGGYAFRIQKTGAQDAA